MKQRRLDRFLVAKNSLNFISDWLFPIICNSSLYFNLILIQMIFLLLTCQKQIPNLTQKMPIQIYSLEIIFSKIQNYHLNNLFLTNNFTMNKKVAQISISTQRVKELTNENKQNKKVTYELAEQPFDVPNSIKKQIPILKNLFQLNEQKKQINNPNLSTQRHQRKENNLKKQHLSIKSNQKDQRNSPIIVDPIIMKSSIVKILLSQKLLSHSAFFSIVLSVIMVYSENQRSNYLENVITQNTKNMIFLGNFITILMLLNLMLGHYVQVQDQKNSNINEQQEQTSQKNQKILWSFLKLLLKMFITLLHPTIYTISFNHLLHLTMMARLLFIFRYFIRSSSYHNCRTLRLTDIYGIKSNKIFIFAIKSLVQSMKISDVILSYCLVVFVFSHSLYLVSQYQTYQASSNGLYNSGSYPEYNFKFIDCFQIIVVTLPTIGYGQFSMTSIYQRAIILIVMITGASMNSFITLIMLKQFQMNEQQSNSYDLLNKLKLHNKMDELSQRYIVQTINQIRSKINGQQLDIQQKSNRKQILKTLDKTYKQEYNYCRTKYVQISYKDTDTTFSLFKTSLTKLKLTTQQLNNMIFILINKLNKVNRNIEIFKRKSTTKKPEFQQIW